MNSKHRLIATLTCFFVLALTAASVPALLVGIDVSGHESLNPGSQNPASAQTDKKFYCEQSFTNSVWGYQHKGVYVDPQGNVYSYEYQRGDQSWSPKQYARPSEAELEEKYDHGRKPIRKVDPQELLEKYKLVSEASKGAYSKRLSGGTGMGSMVSRCYLFDPRSDSYREVELKVGGDWAYHNTSPSAVVLVKWLESLLTAENMK